MLRYSLPASARATRHSPDKPRRAILLGTIAVALIALGIPTCGAAEARDYPFCLMGCAFGGNGDCSFYSYEQCQASASGRDAWCGANPAFHQAREPQAVRYSRRRI